MYNTTPQQLLFSSLERRLGTQACETWFRPLEFTTSSHDRVLHISAPNAVVKDWVITALSKLRSLNHWRKLKLIGTRFNGPWPKRPDLRILARSRHETRRSQTVATSEALVKEDDVAPFVEAVPSTLNEKYQFSSFVAASCNRFAHAAAKAVAESPGRTYNPLYLYGGVGLGKTHLIQAAGHAIKAANPTLQVAYLSIERFMNELINAIRYGYDKTRVFRERYRSIDVLLIDDVQFIAGQRANPGRIFLTPLTRSMTVKADRAYVGLSAARYSGDGGTAALRFEWGLIADIEPPDLETQRRYSATARLNFNELIFLIDVALFLASNSKHNIRELEGSLIRVMAMASLRGVPLSRALAQDAMRNVSQASESESVTIPMIQKVVADYYKVGIDDLKARSNMRQVLFPRQIAMYLCKRLTRKSYPEIGRQFGGKHHTTVMHSVREDRSTH